MLDRWRLLDLEEAGCCDDDAVLVVLKCFINLIEGKPDANVTGSGVHC